MLNSVFACWVNVECFLKSDFFKKISFFKINFRNIIRVSNSMDQDQGCRFVGTDIGPA